MKKFVLIDIPTMENAYHNFSDFIAIPMPIGITSIAAILERKGYDVKIIDGDAENLTFDALLNRLTDEKPDFVGSTCMTATMDLTNIFYEKLKKRLPKSTVIVGGPHVSALPKRTLEESKAIDIVVKAEGDETAGELMEAIENNHDLKKIKGIAYRKDNTIIETDDRALIKDLGKLPLPAYHLLQYNLYRSYGWNNWVNGYRIPLGVVFTGRGCYGKCSFCAAKIIFKNRIRFFPLERIKKEIDLLVTKYKIRVLYFQDDTFTANKKMVNDICDYLIEKGYNNRLEIMVSSRTDTAHFPTLCKMRKAGVRWICFGVESGNQKVLDIMHKNTTIAQIKDAFEKAYRARLFIAGNYMIGTLGETYETAMDTINLACELKQDYASFAIAIPLPGTELYQYCLDNKIELPTWNEFGNVNTPPIPLNRTLNVQQLIKLRQLATNRFFKRPIYLLGMLWRFNTIAVIKDFLRMYFNVKKEIKAKRY